MSKTTFEKLGIPYEERDGIFYPVLVAGTEKADIDVGKYGRMWIKYIKEEYPMRYKSLVRFGELEERADEVNDTAYELLDDIEAKWLKKHKPKNPNSFTEQLQLRTQTRMMAEEIVIMDVVIAEPAYDNTHANRIRILKNNDLLPREIDNTLYILRKARNDAAHNAADVGEKALNNLQLMYELCVWFMQT